MRFYIFLATVAVSLAMMNEANAQTCEQVKAESLAFLESACGPNVCQTESWGTWCYIFDSPGLRVEVEKTYVTCNYTITSTPIDPNTLPSEQYVKTDIGWTYNCSGEPSVPSSSNGPSGGGRCIGANGSVQKNGSIVSVEAQALGESVEIIGAPLAMHYYSGYQKGRTADYSINVGLTGSAPRDYITSFDVINTRGGTIVDTQSYSNAAAYLTYKYSWNGMDPTNSFNIMSDKFHIVVKENSPAGSFAKTYDISLGHFDAKVFGLGGWLPSGLYFYDASAERIYSWDGSFRYTKAITDYAPSQLMIPAEDGSEAYVFDLNGRHLYTKTGFLGTTVATYNYDSSGKLSSISYPFGRTITFNRNLSGELTSISAPNGQSTFVGIDSNGYVSSFTNPLSETYTFTYYGSQGLLQTFQKPNGEISTFNYSTDGLLTQDSHSGGYFFDLVRSLNSDKTYDFSTTTTMGRGTSIQTLEGLNGGASTNIILPSGRVVNYWYQPDEYDTSYQNQVTSGGETISITSWNHPRFGQFAKAPVSIVESNQYGSRGYNALRSIVLTNTSDPFSISSYMSGWMLSGANAAVTTIFDPATKKFTNTTYLGKTSATVIDSYERPVSFKMGSLNQINLNYTNENLTSIVQGTRTTSLGYNTLGLLESVTNSLSQTTSYVYNSANRLTSKVFPDSRVVGFTYDGVGNLTGVTPPGRPLHSFGINAHGLVGSYAPPALSGVSSVNTTYSYNLDKQITAVTRPSGDSISFNYNATTGVLESLDTSAGNFPYGMDSTTGLPNSISTPANVSMSMSYVGRTPSSTSTSVNGTSVGNYYMTYGSQNLVDSDSVVSGGSGSTTSTIAYLYNDDEDLKKAGDVSLTYNTPNGQLTGTTMGSGTTGFTDTYTYNTYGEVTGYTAKRGTTTIYDLVLTRDGAGRVSGKTQTMNSTTNDYVYGFDSAGRLQQVTKNSVVASNYGYDSNSNRNSGNIGAQTTTATYDDQDRLLTYNTLSFTYNANGDMLTKTNSTTSTTTQYTYDVFGNLTQVVLPGGTTTITYEIDGLNRRIGKKVNGVVQKRWVYMDQYRIAAELNSSGTITKRFIYGTKGNIPDYMIASGVKYRIISDQLGSPRLVVKQSDGTITQRMDHDEFGRIIEDTNPGYLPFGFAGGLYDNQTGIVRFGARDYDPEIGRWMSKDPILFGGGDANLFGYTQNDPANFIDPTGLSDELSDYFEMSARINELGAQAVGDITTAYVAATSVAALAGAAAVTAPEVALAAVNNRYIRIGEGKFPEPYSTRISIGNKPGSKFEIGMSKAGRIDVKLGSSRMTIKQPNSCPVPKK